MKASVLKAVKNLHILRRIEIVLGFCWCLACYAWQNQKRFFHVIEVHVLQDYGLKWGKNFRERGLWRSAKWVNQNRYSKFIHALCLVDIKFSKLIPKFRRSLPSLLKPIGYLRQVKSIKLPQPYFSTNKDL